MKSSFAIVATTVALGLSAPSVYAKGCLKGAAVGGVGGHVAGGHGVAGAAAGCLVGRHMANKKAKQQAPAQGVNEQSAASGK
jgi:hypothetical protein